MAVFGLKLSNRVSFQSKLDPDVGTPSATTFMLKALDSRVMSYLQDNIATVEVNPASGGERVATKFNTAEMHFQTVMFGLDDVQNFLDPDGNQVAFTTVGRTIGTSLYKVASPDLVRMLPTSIIRELAEKILSINSVTEAEAKN